MHVRRQAPRFELFWTDAERDAALPAIAAWVKSRAGKLANESWRRRRPKIAERDLPPRGRMPC